MYKMEEDWGQPLLKDCLFSEVFSHNTPDDLPLPDLANGNQYLFDEEDLSALDSTLFCTTASADVKPEEQALNTVCRIQHTNNTCIPTTNGHYSNSNGAIINCCSSSDPECTAHPPSIFTLSGTLEPTSTSQSRTLADLDSLHVPVARNLVTSAAGSGFLECLTGESHVRVKSEPDSPNGDGCSRQEDMFSEDSYCPQNDGYPGALCPLASPLSATSAQTSVICSSAFLSPGTAGHNGRGVSGEGACTTTYQQTNGIVATGYSTLANPGIGSRYSTMLLPTTTVSSVATSVPASSSSAAATARPRLLIATLPSNSLTVIKRRQLEEASPSPPSSNGSSPSEGLNPPAVACFGPLRNRSKMHELAVKSHLITEQDPRGNGMVLLSPEEKRTLIQEGYTVPTRLPLAKSEEEALKVVRRKIKNKLSAQESRRKRKEYMETLEQKVQNYHSENASLRQRLRQLEQNNRSLTGQLRKLQSAVGASVGSVSIATQTGVCLTAVILMFAVFFPAFPSVVPAQISVWGTWKVDMGQDIPARQLFAPNDLKASRLLLNEENCDIPYSAKFFNTKESTEEEEAEEDSGLSTEWSSASPTEEPAAGVEDDVRSEQRELFWAANGREAETGSGPEAKAPLVDQLNLSLASKSGGNLNSGGNCDMSSCAKAGAPPAPPKPELSVATDA